MTDATIVLADDHTLVRAGLRSLLESLGSFQVVGEAADGREAVRLARQLSPDIVLMDIAMPGLNGLDATARIAREAPASRVIILSMHTAENYVLEALRAGAVGYVVKDAAVTELDLALRAVRRGERWLTPGSGLDLLTVRQREILQLIAEGHSTREIASRLSISIKTAETHRAQVMERLGIHDVAGLTRFALRVGLVAPE